MRQAWQGGPWTPSYNHHMGLQGRKWDMCSSPRMEGHQATPALQAWVVRAGEKNLLSSSSAATGQLLGLCVWEPMDKWMGPRAESLTWLQPWQWHDHLAQASLVGSPLLHEVSRRWEMFSSLQWFWKELSQHLLLPKDSGWLHDHALPQYARPSSHLQLNERVRVSVGIHGC